MVTVAIKRPLGRAEFGSQLARGLGLAEPAAHACVVTMRGPWSPTRASRVTAHSPDDAQR